MVFSSISFLYFFLPLFLGVTFSFPKKMRNFILLGFSLFFYFVGEPQYVILLIISSVVDFFAGLWIERKRNTKGAKVGLIFSIAVNLSMLFFFKYADFMISTINGLMGLSIPLLNIPLPLGISFFTFQTMSYTIDVYRDNVPAQRNFLTFETYVTMFPQLVAGPIVRYTTVAKELHSRVYSVENLRYGTLRFVMGLSKKVLIANQLGELMAKVSGVLQPTALSYWLAIIAFSLQIYFDFSGYSDMAIGIGRILGFNFLENFNYPFIARSVSEFWRRWHISMTTWFREYIYIPLGGNRVSKGRFIFNIFAVWFCTGLWHGASWNFVLWGLYFAVIMIIEKFYIGNFLEKFPQVISRFYVIFVVLISFVIFYNEDLSQIGTWLYGMLGGSGRFLDKEVIYYLKSYGALIMVSILGATPIPKILYHKLFKGEKLQYVLQLTFTVVFLVVSTAYLIDSTFNPFLYFRF